MPTNLERTTHIYKEIDGCAIKADVIGARPGEARPCLVWIHGGGLIFGSRTRSPRPPFLEALLDREFVVVSIDHRFAPETKLAALWEDVRDAWRWVREEGPALFGADPARMAMAGGSSGGYLSLLGGYLLRPAPRAIASFSGFGDITASWEADPSGHYRTIHPLVSRDEAARYVGTVPVSEPPHDDRDWFYLYCRQHGKWLEEVTAHDPRDEPGWFDRWCPLRNISSDYPPTMLVHGTLDTDVPCAESKNLAARLEKAGVRHEFVSLESVGHGFAGAAPEVAEQAESAVAAFLVANL